MPLPLPLPLLLCVVVSGGVGVVIDDRFFIENSFKLNRFPLLFVGLEIVVVVVVVVVFVGDPGPGRIKFWGLLSISWFKSIKDDLYNDLILFKSCLNWLKINNLSWCSSILWKFLIELLYFWKYF